MLLVWNNILVCRIVRACASARWKRIEQLLRTAGWARAGCPLSPPFPSSHHLFLSHSFFNTHTHTFDSFSSFLSFYLSYSSFFLTSIASFVFVLTVLAIVLNVFVVIVGGSALLYTVLRTHDYDRKKMIKNDTPYPN